jgi:predicted DNA-binding transcriptional regulator AlpA
MDTKRKDASPTPIPPDRIVSEKEACAIRNVSPDTLQRQAARGEGPERIKLSPRRVGYRLSSLLK